MDVLRGIITEEEAFQLPMDIFKTLAACASSIVITRIDAYIKSPNATEVVVRRVREAFSEVNRKKEYYDSEELAQMADELSSLSYADISANKSLECLEHWYNAIDKILNSEFSVAYVAPIRSNTLRELLDLMLESKSPAAITVASKIENGHTNLFKDAPFKGYRGTPIKRIITNRSQYEVYLRGLKFLIERKKAGDNPGKWRYM